MNQEKNLRLSGVLVHPTSFPSRFGIGDLGSGAREFLDFLNQSNQNLWQLLPIGPTGFGDSPYQCVSAFAGQPLLISPDELVKEGLLSESDLYDIPYSDPWRVNYGEVIPFKKRILRKTWENFQSRGKGLFFDSFQKFCEDERYWLLDYALFMSIKESQEGRSWTDWPRELQNPGPVRKQALRAKFSDEIKYYSFVQFLFYHQWDALRNYAKERDITIIGDLPLFLSHDSADVWAHKELFELDSKGFPIEISGVPPDLFSQTGQLWGNPLYHWENHKKDHYAWWTARIKKQLELADYIRIDHFQGFELYWGTKYGSENAINGHWRKGPGKEFFETVEKNLGQHLPIIAEDLGILTDEVVDMRDSFNYPGMKILQYAFNNPYDNDLLPHHFIENSVCYTATVDTDTTIGWYQSAYEPSKDKARRYMNTDGSAINWDFIRTAMGSIARFAIFPIQDVLSLGSDARMNIPGKIDGNWGFRYPGDLLHKNLVGYLKQITECYGRGICI